MAPKGFFSHLTLYQAVHSPSKSAYSAHEGQVVLSVSYPVGTPCNKKTFEDGLRAMLSAEGLLYAWQKLAATEAGVFRMVAEFGDSALALHAVQRLDGKRIKVSQGGDVIISLELHTPDLPQSSRCLGQMTSLARPSGEQSEISDALGRMSLIRYQTTGHQSRAETLPTAISDSSTLPLVASNPSAFSLQTPMSAGLPVMMGGIYAPAHISYPLGYSALMHHRYLDASDVNAVNTHTPGDFDLNDTPVVQSGFVGGQNPPVVQGFQHLTFHQPPQQINYGSSLGNSAQRSMSNYRDGGYFNRPSGRRQNAVRAPQHSIRSRQFSTPAAGHHNHVDIHRIRQGIDVRTTVNLSLSATHKCFSSS